MALSDSRPDQTPNMLLQVAIPASGTGLPRYPRYLPDMLSPLPRWTGTGGSVTACQVAAALSAYIFPQSFSRRISPAHCLGSYRDEPTISRAGPAPAGILRPRGAPIYSVCTINAFHYSDLNLTLDLGVRSILFISNSDCLCSHSFSKITAILAKPCACHRRLIVQPIRIDVSYLASEYSHTMVATAILSLNR